MTGLAIAVPVVPSAKAAAQINLFREFIVYFRQFVVGGGGTLGKAIAMPEENNASNQALGYLTVGFYKWV
jgi:hypothetical protein